MPAAFVRGVRLLAVCGDLAAARYPPRPRPSVGIRQKQTGSPTNVYPASEQRLNVRASNPNMTADRSLEAWKNRHIYDASLLPTCDMPCLHDRSIHDRHYVDCHGSGPLRDLRPAVLNIAIGSAGRFASLLPGYRFCRSPDQCFKTRRSLLSRLGPDARNGLSLARNGCSFRSFHSEVNVPGLLLRFQLAASSARSALLLRYPVRLAPVSAASMLLARCRLD
jgi:hypothetical protein